MLIFSNQQKKQKKISYLSLFSALNVLYLKYVGVTHHAWYHVQYRSVFILELDFVEEDEGCPKIEVWALEVQKWHVCPVLCKMLIWLLAEPFWTAHF